jgi:hypothetical protein
LSAHAVEHLDDEALLGAGKARDPLELLVGLGRVGPRLPMLYSAGTLSG